MSEDDFTDTYAQTITYGLLTAAIARTDMSAGPYGTALIAENVNQMVPITNPFLREMLQTFINVGEHTDGIDFDELGIQEVIELLRGEGDRSPRHPARLRQSQPRRGSCYPFLRAFPEGL